MTEETSPQALAAKLRRHAGLIRLLALALLIVGILLITGALPVKQGVEKVESWIRELIWVDEGSAPHGRSSTTS